jgi:tetratricopeptide (TPR) repeat protein
LNSTPTRYFWISCIALCALSRGLCADEPDGVTLPQRNLKRIVERQKIILDNANKGGETLDVESIRVQLQEVCHEYDLLVHDSPNFAAGYASYGYLLSKLGMQKEAAIMLLKANSLDPDIPLVKNQIGNYLAEEGRPLEAINYYIAAIKLAPDQPLYHYQLGSLLYEARNDFIKKGIYTRPQLDETMLSAFKKAAELAPERIEFTYRYAEAFYDLEKPDWPGALIQWAHLEEKAKTNLERETMRLHAVNVLIKDNRYDHASLLIRTISEPQLDKQKQKLITELNRLLKK